MKPMYPNRSIGFLVSGASQAAAPLSPHLCHAHHRSGTASFPDQSQREFCATGIFFLPAHPIGFFLRTGRYATCLCVPKLQTSVFLHSIVKIYQYTLSRQ
jgi:hypothetical protein